MPTNLSLNGSAAFDASGKFGQALIFDGTAAGVATSAAKVPSSGNVTVGCWIKTTSTALKVFIGQAGAFWMGVDTGGVAKAAYGNGGGEVTISTSTVINDGNWHHLELDITSGGGAKFFVDGTLAGSSATTETMDRTTNTIEVGTLVSDPTLRPVGRIDEIAIWNTIKHSANFTPPSTAWVGNETNLAYLWHLDGNGNDSTGSSGATAIAPNNAAFVYSPYNWTTPTSSNTKTINSGAYFRVMFTGTSCILNFDMANMGTPVSQIYYRIDGYETQAPWTKANVSASVTVSMPSDTNPASYHLLEVVVKSTSETLNRWNSGTGTAIVFTGLTLDTSASVLAPASYSRKVLIYGDSITEGVRTINETAVNDTDRNDALASWAIELGRRLCAEVGVVGFGATGWTLAGSGNVPAFSTSYNLIMSGVSRSFTPEPTAIFINLGTNDGGASSGTVTTAVTNTINNLLSATTVCPIVTLRPFNGTQATAIQNGVTGTGSARAYYADTTGVFNTAYGADSGTLHPTAANCLGKIAPQLANLLVMYAEPRRFNVTVS